MNQQEWFDQLEQLMGKLSEMDQQLLNNELASEVHHLLMDVSEYLEQSRVEHPNFYAC